MMRHCLGIALLATVLAGCGPDKTRLAIDLAASTQINPNSEQQYSPTVVRIYELRSIDKFNAATFFQLYDSDAATLGPDMLHRRELTVLPNEQRKLDSVVDPTTAFVGVLAAFRDLNGAGWRASLPVRAHENNRMILDLGTNTVTLLKPKPSSFLWIF